MIKKIVELLGGGDSDIRDKIFRFIVVMGSAVAVFAMIESALFMQIEEIFVPLFILILTMITFIIAAFKLKRMNILANVMGIVLIGIIFPAIYFVSGGDDGGSSGCFIIGILYVFIMFKGWKLLFYLLFALAATIWSHLYGYYHPEIIVPITSEFMSVFDSIFSVIIVGVSGGLIVLYQSRVYEKERDKNKKLKDELEEINKNKSALFVNMSHELRTPINTITGMNEMILRKEQDEEIREYALGIKNTSTLLLSLVNDILDISKIEMQRMEIVPDEYETKSLFKSIIEIIQIPMSEKKIKFIVDIDKTIPSILFGDVKRIKQIILNILTNAVKYTEEGSVTFSVTNETLDSELTKLIIRVTDTGIGIRKEDIKFLYNSFRRVNLERNNEVQGTGLGLAITKQLVDMMNGEIKVDSIYTKGTTFSIVLPQKVIEKKTMGTFEYNEIIDVNEYYKHLFEAPEAKILVVDDNEMNLKVIKNLLERTKVQVYTATSGAECLKKTEEQYYDVILLDYVMPNMNGVETLRQIRVQTNGLCRDIPILALTADTSLKTQADHGKYSFDGYLEKPIVPAKLEEELLRCIPADIIEYSREASNKQVVNTAISNIQSIRKKKLLITTDCVCDLPQEVIETLDIRIMYLYIKTDKGRFADTSEMDSDCLTKNNPLGVGKLKADSVSVEEQESFFANVLTEAEEVIHFSLAKNLGKSYNIAVTASQSFDNVYVVDSGYISCGQGLVVMMAAEFAKRGFKTKEIVNAMESISKKVQCSFILPSKNLMAVNGYVEGVVAKLWSKFNIRPVVTLKNSNFAFGRAYIGGTQKIWERYIRKQLFGRATNSDIIFVTHAGLNAEQKEFVKKQVLQYVPGKRVIFQKSSVSCACNSGLPAIGIAYYNE